MDEQADPGPRCAQRATGGKILTIGPVHLLAPDFLLVARVVLGLPTVLLAPSPPPRLALFLHFCLADAVASGAMGCIPMTPCPRGFRRARLP